MIWLVSQVVRAVTSTVVARAVWVIDEVANPACRCGHIREAHRHYRPGSDCGACGPDRCPVFERRPRRFRR